MKPRSSFLQSGLSLRWLSLLLLLLPLGIPPACSSDGNTNMNQDMGDGVMRMLTVTSKGTGMGSVSSAPAGITCSPTCQASFAAGTQVTLTATPSAGSFFTAWDGACTGSTPTCTVTLSADQQVGATFDVNPSLSGLTLSAGALSPAFDAATLVYTAQVPGWVSSLQLTPTVGVPGATVTVNGMQVTSGMASQAVTVGTGVTMINVVVSFQGMTRTYAVAVSQAPNLYIKSSNTGASDNFGNSIAATSDTLVIGARFEDSNATGIGGNQADNSAVDSGAVYVFVRNGTTWTQQAYIKASNTGAGDQFGNSVALSGDTLAVGALFEASNATGINGNQADNSNAGAGAVYVFVRNGTTWTQQAYIKASNTGTGDQFGFSVSLSGDTLAVGANAEDSNATGINGNGADNSAGNAGAAYVFVRNGTTWTQQAYLKPSNTDGNDLFGTSVSVSGDTVAVGSLNEASNATGVGGNPADNSAGGAGAVYVFFRNGTNWTQQAYIKASNTNAGDTFGSSVSLSGDTLAIAAVLEASNATGIGGNQADNSSAGAGAVYVFTRNGTTWSQQAYVKASNTGTDDQFGASLVLSGDTLVVGAPRESSNATGINGNQADNSSSRAGAAYVFTRSGTTWTQRTYVKATNTGAMDGFGMGVALSGSTVVVTATGEDSNATGVGANQVDNSAANSGAVYLF